MGVLGPFKAKSETSGRRRATEEEVRTMLDHNSVIKLNPILLTDIDPDILKKYGVDSEEAQKAYDDIMVAYQSMMSHYISIHRKKKER